MDASPGDARVEFAFPFEDGAAPVAEASAALGWKPLPSVYQRLRAHPAAVGALFEAKGFQLKAGKPWARRN
jgi:hypothetical protein